MTLVKKLTKEDLINFDKELDEFCEICAKMAALGQTLSQAGAVAPLAMFNDAWLEVAQNSLLCRTLNTMQILQFEEMKDMSAEQRGEHLKKFAFASLVAANIDQSSQTRPN